MTDGPDEPPSTLKEAVHDLYRWRGTIVGGLAQFETLLLDLCIQLDAHPDYAGLLKFYPERPADMIKHMESLFALPGALQPLAKILTKAFRDYEHASVDRNLYAHGAMSIKHAQGVPLYLTVNLWHREKPGATRRTETVLWYDFKAHAQDVSDFADKATAELTMVYALLGGGNVTTFKP